ncbi:MAG TPA: NapC/NirT family cytochrome c [Thermoanaerobaculia bacterium]|nr:NapC/NirT family cytochrome c [Thermoanaerobaculia bacterium]
MWRSFFIALTRNAVSLLGAAIVTASGFLIVTLFLLDLLGFKGSPYLGIIAFLILPAIFILGLLLIPIGIAWQRRRDRRAELRGEAPPAFPVLDLNDRRTRRRALAFVILTLVNAVILSAATYKGVETMDSTTFCGKTCHSVMQPEDTAHARGAHASVACVDCHIGPGAGWFVKSKLSGTWQVIAVTFDLYPRPIPTPVHSLRPARETCQQCHWPSKFVGDRLKVIDGFNDDEANTPAKTVLLVRVGGRQGSASQGIHWHVDPGVAIRYLSDESRETIYQVEMRTPDGKVTRFTSKAQKPAAGAVWRTMDCVDCHNRPSHTFQPPEKEVDAAIAAGRIDRALPFVHREGVRLLKAAYPSHAAADREIADGLRAFYAKQYPQVAMQKSAAIGNAAAALSSAYRANVFPSMKIGWGTYPNHIGHESSPGCFRCHDEEHAAPDGRKISQDCSTCHSLLAMGEEDPQILHSLEQ